MVKIIDLHGFKLEEAPPKLIEKEIGKIRLSGIPSDLHVITGRGVIRVELKKYLELNDIDHNYEWGNDAIIIRVE